MSSFPTLSKHQLFQSHLVNCDICRKYESASVELSDIEGFGKSFEVKTKPQVNRRMCPVGVKLFNEALKEDPSKSPFRPKSFPYVAKIYEVVKFRPTGTIEWIQGKVIDRSLGDNGRVMGYEVQIVTKSSFEGVLDKVEEFYVNPVNIKPLISWKEKQEALKQQEMQVKSVLNEAPSTYTPGKFKFRVGGHDDQR